MKTQIPSPKNPLSKTKRSPPIVFLKVSDTLSKLMRICDVVHKYFSLQQRVLISVQNDASATFIDNLLWRLPQESFIPHSISNKPCNEAIVITTSLENYNSASTLISLRTQANPMVKHFSTNYELNDHTNPQKHHLSQKRLTQYEKLGHPIIHL